MVKGVGYLRASRQGVHIDLVGAGTGDLYQLQLLSGAADVGGVPGPDEYVGVQQRFLDRGVIGGVGPGDDRAAGQRGLEIVHARRKGLRR